MSDAASTETPGATGSSETPAGDPSADAALDAFLKGPPAAPAEEAATEDKGEAVEGQGAEEGKQEEAPKDAKDEPASASAARRVFKAADDKLTEAKALVGDLGAALRKDLRGTLSKIGFTLDDLIDLDIAQGGGPAAAAADDKAKPKTEPDERDQRIARLEAEAAARKAAEDQDKLDKHKAKIVADVEADPRFPTIKAKGLGSMVTDFMVEYFETHRTRIAWDKAAQIVENDLRGLTGAPSPKPAIPAPAAKTPAPATTLTNGDVRTYVPPNEDEIPEVVKNNPDKLIRFLVEDAEKKSRATA